jgi:hypothetical protein
MLSKIPAMKLVHKAVAATVICGAVALGTGGAAFAATPGSTPAATGAHRCVRADKALARVEKAEAAVTQRLPKLQAEETKLTTKGRTKAAARVEKRIARLNKIETKAGALASKIETKCPSGTSS